MFVYKIYTNTSLKNLLVSAPKYYIFNFQVPKKFEKLTFMMQKNRFHIQYSLLWWYFTIDLVSRIAMQHICMIYTSIQNTANSFTDNDFSLHKLGIKLNASPVALLYKKLK